MDKACTVTLQYNNGYAFAFLTMGETWENLHENIIFNIKHNIKNQVHMLEVLDYKNSEKESKKEVELKFKIEDLETIKEALGIAGEDSNLYNRITEVLEDV